MVYSKLPFGIYELLIVLLLSSCSFKDIIYDVFELESPQDLCPHGGEPHDEKCIRSCTFSNGKGEQYYLTKSSVASWSPCYLIECNTGYERNENSTNCLSTTTAGTADLSHAEPCSAVKCNKAGHYYFNSIGCQEKLLSLDSLPLQANSVHHCLDLDSLNQVNGDGIPVFSDEISWEDIIDLRELVPGVHSFYFTDPNGDEPELILIIQSGNL